MDVQAGSAVRTEKTKRRAGSASKGLTVSRRFTTPEQEPLDLVSYTPRRSVIANPDGSLVFEFDDAEVPESWSQLATDVVVSKYFRKAGVPGTGRETSVRQLVYRVAHTIRRSGEEQGGYFASAADADAFEAELSFLLVNQFGAFNSPVWFNCGLWHEYGIPGSGGNYAWHEETQSVFVTKDAYSRPQVSACFIQAVGDDLMSIFDLLRNEARVFKYGSGTGTNFSRLRGHMEKLSGGGTSSGLMSFLEVFDRGAGATKSGGTTRRAAKMVVLDMDHPEIVDFINWKRREEKKAQALIEAGYPADFNGEAYHTVSGQNSNNSVRVTDAFMQAVIDDETWQTTLRTTGEVHETHQARHLWKEIGEAAWACADPGVQYDDTIQKWHTCKGTDRINATNPCSEFVFLDDTACNLASVNLVKFLRDDGSFDVEAYRHACRIFFLAQEILVDLASYPTQKIAERSHAFRPLGLGYANLGTMLMIEGMPYDSDAARAVAAALTAIMTGEAYGLSAEMARSKGPFDGFAANRESMLGVMRLHREAAAAVDSERCPAELYEAANASWERAVALGEEHGYRNAQATVLAPTGTIGLLMDCDTTGIEPDFALVKFKKLAGGGYFKIVNQSVPRALRRLGYDAAAIEQIVAYAVGTGTLLGAPHVNKPGLLEKGLTEEELGKVEAVLPTVLELKNAFTAHVLGAETLTRLGVDEATRSKPGFSLLRHLGFTAQEIAEASGVICGRMTVEGAPGLDPDHLPVFDCANRCGSGKRFIAPMGHVRMMAAVQPFISGAISKTVNLPADATVADVEDIYLQSWKLGLKAVALYRDGSKASQPLNSSKKDDGKEQEKEKARAAAQPEAPKRVPVPAQQMGPALQRKRLPKRRAGWTQEAKVGGHKVFVRTGEYEDGKLGEIFIDMHKEGAAYRSMMNCFAIAVSMGMQYGVPLEALVEQFTFTRFEPQGPVDGHPNLKFATSVIDYIFRLLGYEYLGRTDLVQVKPEDLESAHSEIKKPLSSEPATPEGARGEAAAPGTNGAGNGASEPRGAARGPDELFANLLGDAPFCDLCGHITVRNGSCYRCLNCGHSMGCS